MAYEAQTKLITVEKPELKRMYLIPFGDIHLGMPECNIPKLCKYLDWVAERDDAYLCGLGDWFETPINLSRVNDGPVWPNGMSTSEVVDQAVALFAPVRDKILFLIKGNHEERASSKTGTDALDMLATRLGLRDLLGDEQAIMKLTVGDVKYTLMAQHGWGGARKTGGQVNKMEELAAVTGDADVYVTGHEHTLFMSRWDKDIVGNDEIVELRQMYVGCGCFVGYTRFQRRIARRKPNIGAPRIRFNGTKRDVHVSI